MPRSLWLAVVILAVVVPASTGAAYDSMYLHASVSKVTDRPHLLPASVTPGAPLELALTLDRSVQGAPSFDGSVSFQDAVVSIGGNAGGVAFSGDRSLGSYIQVYDSWPGAGPDWFKASGYCDMLGRRVPWFIDYYDASGQAFSSAGSIPGLPLWPDPTQRSFVLGGTDPLFGFTIESVLIHFPEPAISLSFLAGGLVLVARKTRRLQFN